MWSAKYATEEYPSPPSISVEQNFPEAHISEVTGPQSGTTPHPTPGIDKIPSVSAIQHNFGIKIPYSTAFHGKEVTNSKIHSSFENTYKSLPE